MQIPNFVTHYSRGTPFRSMTHVPQENWSKVIAELNETNAWGVSRFKDPEYLSRRLEVENSLREKFISKGGKPILRNPIYFFLGRNNQFEEHKGNIGYKIYLKDLPSGSISFTYGDSLIGHNEDYRNRSGEKYQNVLSREIFLFEEIHSLFLNEKFPKNDRLNVEAQLWVEPSKEIVQFLD